LATPKIKFQTIKVKKVTEESTEVSSVQDQEDTIKAPNFEPHVNF
jgi:hypothetical protein